MLSSPRFAGATAGAGRRAVRGGERRVEGFVSRFRRRARRRRRRSRGMAAEELGGRRRWRCLRALWRGTPLMVVCSCFGFVFEHGDCDGRREADAQFGGAEGVREGARVGVGAEGFFDGTSSGHVFQRFWPSALRARNHLPSGGGHQLDFRRRRWPHSSGPRVQPRSTVAVEMLTCGRFVQGRCGGCGR